MKTEGLVTQLLQPFSIEPYKIQSMDGYGSRNYKIEDIHSQMWVFKHFRPEEVENQKAIADSLLELGHHDMIALPQPVRINGHSIHIYKDGSAGRLTRFLTGTFLADSDLSTALIKDLGHHMGLLVQSLQRLTSPIIKSKEMSWDLRYSGQCYAKLHHIASPSDRKLIHYFLNRYRDVVLPRYDKLRRGLIHNDWNDWNILCQDNTVVGLIDFGDMVHGPIVQELAVGLCYLLMLSKDVLVDAALLTKSFHEAYPLTCEDVDLLYYMVAARLCLSVCHSAEAKTNTIDTAYILINERPAWALLHEWVRLSPDRFAAELKEALGLVEADDQSDLPFQLEREKETSEPFAELEL